MRPGISVFCRQPKRLYKVAQLATAESALLASRAELGSERAEAALESRSTAMLEAEANDFQALRGGRVALGAAWATKSVFRES